MKRMQNNAMILQREKMKEDGGKMEIQIEVEKGI